MLVLVLLCEEESHSLLIKPPKVVLIHLGAYRSSKSSGIVFLGTEYITVTIMASVTPAVVAGKSFAKVSLSPPACIMSRIPNRSFLQVAAMKPPHKVVKNQNPQVKATGLQKDTSSASPTPNSSPSAKVVPASPNRLIRQNQARDDIAAAVDGVEKLSVKSETSSQRSSNDSSKINVPVTGVTEDDGSHLSNSSMKPASFDTKSMASENTFALDEKESLRPDDSASVQAADEDDQLFVPPLSGRPDHQMALERGNTGIRRSMHDEPVPVSLAARRVPISTMANPPRFGEVMPTVSQCFPSNVTSTNQLGANQIGVESPQQYAPAPMPLDERLIEAMGTPKDRLLLLQLEEKFLAFITKAKYVTCEDHV